MPAAYNHYAANVACYLDTKRSLEVHVHYLLYGDFYSLVYNASREL